MGMDDLVRDGKKVRAQLVQSIPVRSDKDKPLERIEGITFNAKGDLFVLTENDGGCNPRPNRQIAAALPNAELVIPPVRRVERGIGAIEKTGTARTRPGKDGTLLELLPLSSNVTEQQ